MLVRLLNSTFTSGCGQPGMNSLGGDLKPSIGVCIASTTSCPLTVTVGIGVSGLVSKWVNLAPNGTNPGLF